MSGSSPTRRELLSGGAGLVAGSLALPSLARAAPGGPAQPGTVELGAVSRAALTVELERSADLVGLQWRGPATAALRLRYRGAGGRWSPWLAAGAAGHGPEAPARGRWQSGEPLWTGGTRVVQLAAASDLEAVRLRTVDVSSGAGARNASSAARRPLAEPHLAAGPGQPPIIARSGWAGGNHRPAVAPEYGDVEMAFVHHTDSANDYSPGEVPSMLRGIYIYHRFVNGWNDIGYNFAVDLYGSIWEARAGGIDQSVVGAQAGGFNTTSTGIAVLGNFEYVDISAAARRSLQALLAWKLALHGVPSRGRVTVRATSGAARWSSHRPGEAVTLPRIAGHRQADQTSCPGNDLFAHLGAIRTAVHAAFPAPLTLTLALGAQLPEGAEAPLSPPAEGETKPVEPPPSQPSREVHGRLRAPDGAPLEGAEIAIEARTVTRRGERVSERTLVTATTDGEGSYQAAVPDSRGAVLRALCASAGRFGAVRSPDVLLRARAAVSRR